MYDPRDDELLGCEVCGCALCDGSCVPDDGLLELAEAECLVAELDRLG